VLARTRITRILFVAVLATAGLLATYTPAQAADPNHRKQIDRVAKRLLAVIEPPADLEWPPRFEIEESKEINAYANVLTIDKKKVPIVVVYSALLDKVVEGKDERLAFILGHELGHIVLGHCPTLPPATEFRRVVFQRQQELDADLHGIEIALKAGFPLKETLDGVRKFFEAVPAYNSFEGLGVDHPSGKDRLAHIDKAQSKLWHAMSAFDTGTYLLLFEQYIAAERCFREVVKQFPSCPEGWANLGYAQLMQYCDALDPDDLRNFDIGQVMAGGFYRRPVSLETQLRGVNEELWWEAVGSLREALRLNADSAVARANLGIAYLLRPSGRNIGQARKFLDEAAEKARVDSALHPLVKASILLNAGVADMSDAAIEEAVKNYNEAETLAKKFGTTRGSAGTPLAVATSLRYNRAIMLAASTKVEDRKAAVESFERYLLIMNPASAWWPLAYERYAKLCQELRITAKSKADLSKANKLPLRLVTSLTMPGDVSISLNEPLADVRKTLGPGNDVPVVRNTKLMRVKYPQHGIELIAAENILAISLSGSKAPELPIRPVGVGAPSFNLKVGMKRDEIEKLLHNEEFDFCEIDQPGVSYRFYPDLGLALRVRQGKVEELVIVQMPRRRF